MTNGHLNVKYSMQLTKKCQADMEILITPNYVISLYLKTKFVCKQISLKLHVLKYSSYK